MTVLHDGIDTQRATPLATAVFSATTQAGLALRLTVTCGSAATVRSGYHFPGFGLCQENNVICVERTGVLPIEMHYRIERL